MNSIARSISIMAVGAGAIVLGSEAIGHHSFPATYQVDQEVTIEGELVAFLLRNPHAFVHVAVTDADGTTTRWALEWGGATQLTQSGVTQETLKPGDHVIVSGNPGRREEDHRMRVQKIERPSDGWVWEGEFN